MFDQLPNIRVGKVPDSTHYCGRSKNYKPEYGIDCSVLSNPFPLYKESDRDQNIEKYKYYFIHMIQNDILFRNNIEYIISDIKNGKNVVLGCFCFPKKCHCDIIKFYIIKRTEK